MINFEELELRKEEYRNSYLTAKPFPHLVLHNICDISKLTEMYHQIPRLENKSRDLIFAKNKFEKSAYYNLGPLFQELYDDLCSDKMNSFLSYLTGKNTFVDPKNHGGGLHQGQGNSKLDMHLDFNYHPLHNNWWREMNLLLYLNKNWQENYGGHLKIRDLRTDEETALSVPFNTLIIQKCSDYSLHGYDLTSFPEGIFRTSIATYAFTQHIRQLAKKRTTDWFVNEKEGPLKVFLGRNIHRAIKIKNMLFKSGTSKNQ